MRTGLQGLHVHSYRLLAGFGAALTRGDTWLLVALVVAPDAHGRRGRRRPADRCGAGEFRHPSTITDAIQPVPTGLDARRGLIPTTPILTLSGTPRCWLPDGLHAGAPQPVAPATLDRGAYGFDRGVDHRCWGARAAAVWLLGGEPIADAYVDRQGLIGPLAGRDGAAAAVALRGGVGSSGGAAGGGAAAGDRGGPGGGAGSGLWLTGPPGLLLLSGGTDAPQALAISSYWLR